MAAKKKTSKKVPAQRKAIVKPKTVQLKPKAKPKAKPSKATSVVKAKKKVVAAKGKRVPIAAKQSVQSASIILVEIDYDAVAKRAYEIWEAKGRPGDHDHHNWVQAEAEIRAAMNKKD